MTLTDPRRNDLVVPYTHRPAINRDKPTAVFSSTIPMAAMFMKSKILGWCGVFFATQSWLEEPAKRAPDAQPAWLSILIACFSLCVCYMDLFVNRKII